MFRCVVGGECTTALGHPLFVSVGSNYGMWYAVMYCLIMFSMTFGLFNVIVALFVENTLEAARSNDLKSRRLRLLDTEMFAHRMKALVEFIWHAWENRECHTAG